MRIVEKFLSPSPAFSFEFFPPKDEEGMRRLFDTVVALGRYKPAYVSVTYGAGGSTRPLTVELVRRIKEETGIETMAHLTCVGATREELLRVLEELVSARIENILALRGDPPKGAPNFTAKEGGFAHASELVAFIRERYPQLCLGVAGYPERHPEAEDFASDLQHLAEKVAAGADFVVTQLFFDERDYANYVDRARRQGIAVPIVPGIMPITNVSQIKRFTAQCGAHVPARLLAELELRQSDAEAVRALGVEHALAECRSLLAQGVPAIHFYTLNRSTATVEILQALLAASR